MKNLYIMLIFTLSGFLFGETSFISGFLNDNYTGTAENGINGNYIGADDFLTLTLFVKSIKDNLSISEYYQVVTSRKFGYRYDLFETRVEYLLEYEYFDFSPKVSIIFKGDYSGEYIQNSIHTSKDLPTLELDYTEPSSSLSTGGILTYNYDPFKIRLDLELPLSIKPVYVMGSTNYRFSTEFVDIDIVGGYKQYINSVDEYSELVRSGFLGGAEIILKPYKSFTINAGALFFPAKNLENDEVYADIDHSYSPQFWVTFGLNGDTFDILDIVDF